MDVFVHKIAKNFENETESLLRNIHNILQSITVKAITLVFKKNCPK